MVTMGLKTKTTSNFNGGSQQWVLLVPKVHHFLVIVLLVLTCGIALLSLKRPLQVASFLSSRLYFNVLRQPFIKANRGWNPQDN